MEHKTQRTQRKAWETRQVEFGILDQYGRAIGAEIHTTESEYTAMSKEELAACSSYYTTAPGSSYALAVQATRNGQSYGASQAEREFATLPEREQAIEKYLTSARKRAALTARKSTRGTRRQA